MPALLLRPANAEDAEAIATIWYSGWRNAHLELVPAALVAARPPELFRSRAAQYVGDTVVAVAGHDHEIAGFVIAVGDEVAHIYVAARHRGSEAAGLLLAEAERLAAVADHRQAWLVVATDNARARRFYERCGWTDDGPFDSPTPIPGGTVTVHCHRYTKSL